VGILGAGFIAPVHVDALRRLGGVEVVAIAASSESRARERAAVMGIPTAYAGYAALLSDSSIEVVHNCTPTPLHAETTSASLTAGKHVVADKPLASTLTEAQALLAAARSAGRIHAVTFNHRAFRAIQQVRALISEGALEARPRRGC
jgi:predicted dehydrogenase